MVLYTTNIDGYPSFLFLRGTADKYLQMEFFGADTESESEV